MIDLNIILERLCQIVESGTIKHNKFVVSALNSISDKELLEIIDIAEMLFEKVPNSLSPKQNENCYLYGELIIMFAIAETNNYSLTIRSFKQKEWEELVNNFTDRLCLEYAERMNYLEVIISKYFPREFKISLTNKGKSYLFELNKRSDYSFIDKRLGLQMILIGAYNK